MRRTAWIAVGACLLTLTGCTHKDDKAGATPAPSYSAPPVSPLPTCGPVKPTVYTWPKQIPQDLPRLPGAVLESSKTTTDGLFIVLFSTKASLRDGVLFIVKKLPAAGFQLARGDAEQTEADAPFRKGDLRGVLRGAAIGLCETKWVLAVARTTRTSPLLPAHQGPSPSPLPFG
ncbi:MAG: hypothetical protein QOJ79_1009 [Actinomycetota bacterium]|jgi:hypothetical protein|nr:hypothetical protein [Actinomycetota bacterium]